MRLRRRRSSRGGFTLVELLVSMGVSTVGLLGLMQLQMVALRGNMASRSFIEATGLAQERVELAAADTYATLAALDTSAAPETIAPSPGSPSAQKVYTRKTSVSVDAVNNFTTVTVLVSWADADTAQHAVTLVSRRSP